MINFILYSIVIGLLVYLFFKRGTKNHDVFEKQGLKYQKPLPFIGNSGYILSGNGLIQRILSCYKMFPNERVSGLFEGGTPLYFIRCPEIVKTITIKDFPYFQDHVTFVDSASDDFFGNALFLMQGKQWRDMRTSLSPMFTGSKMRIMLQLITKCTEQVVDYLHDDYKQTGIKTYRMKDMFSRYTNDVIATCAFGVECNSLRQPKNEIFQISQEILKFQKSSVIVKFLVMQYLPSLARLFKIKVFDDKTIKTFKRLIIGTMDVRRKESIIRPDLLQLLMKLKDGQVIKQEKEDETELEDEIGNIKTSWTDEELIAQCFQFFFAGFDTTSTAMSFLSYELAINSDVQSKLIEEVDEIYEYLEGKALSYETLHKMKYMDMVISETLRKWPTLPVLDRKCVKEYTYEDDDGLKFTIGEGSMIWIPAYAFNMDPKYFPNPDTFDPERFSEENKAQINMNTYLPFGIGPRNCIGMRFALMEIKALLFNILRNFRFKVAKETQVPIKLKNSLFGFIPEEEIKLTFEPRTII